MDETEAGEERGSPRKMAATIMYISTCDNYPISPPSLGLGDNCSNNATPLQLLRSPTAVPLHLYYYLKLRPPPGTLTSTSRMASHCLIGSGEVAIPCRPADLKQQHSAAIASGESSGQLGTPSPSTIWGVEQHALASAQHDICPVVPASPWLSLPLLSSAD